jgi:hypothetical protein
MLKTKKSGLVLNPVVAVSVLLLMTLLISCGEDSSESSADKVKGNTSGLSEWELENGFGPVKKKLNLGPIDKTMAAEGEKIFESKCASCHKLDERYVGPAQRDVLRRITPEFFMNMVINPEENVEKHPHTKEMLGQYMQKMTNQNINLKDARTLLEYFRVIDKELVSQNKSN